MKPRNFFGAPKALAMVSTGRTRFSMNPLAWFCMGYYALAISWGARSAVVSERSAGDIAFQVTMALCLGIWAVADARQRQKPISRFQQSWFLILAGLVVPGYVIVTRGWKGLGWVVLHVVSWIAIANLAMHIAGFIYFGDAWWTTMGFAD